MLSSAAVQLGAPSCGRQLEENLSVFGDMVLMKMDGMARQATRVQCPPSENHSILPPYKFEKPALSDIFYTEGFDGCAYMIEVKPFQQTFLLMKSDVGRTYLWTRKT